MIHARTDYDRIQDPAGLIGEDEPVMLFRAKDRLFIPVLAHYAMLLEKNGAERHMIDAVYEQMSRVLQWQKRGNKTQTPDMPKEAVRS